MTTILGVKLDNRVHTAIEFQKVLTNYGCIIRTRLGLHDVADNKCPTSGIVLLEVIDDKQALEFENELCEIEGIEIQSMRF